MFFLSQSYYFQVFMNSIHSLPLKRQIYLFHGELDSFVYKQACKILQDRPNTTGPTSPLLPAEIILKTKRFTFLLLSSTPSTQPRKTACSTQCSAFISLLLPHQKSTLLSDNLCLSLPSRLGSKLHLSGWKIILHNTKTEHLKDRVLPCF